MRGAWVVAALSATAGAASVQLGCGSTEPTGAPEAGTYPSVQSLIDPGVCKLCHKDHYTDWSRSVHAKAADDPVFLAMNKRGQRETDGGLGNFCVQCHAPMAVRRDPSHNVGQDLANGAVLDANLKGVTCYFCHSVDAVDAGAPYNANLSLANDGMMRGEIKDPVANDIHPSAHSNLLDREELASSTMCGVCHDIHSPLGGHIERTFCEWSHSPFNSSELGGTTCASGGFCHMAENSKMQPIASPQATPQGTVNPPLRFYHAHDFPAVDVPLEPIADAGGTTGDVGEEPDAGDGNSAAVDATVAADAGAANMNASDAANTDRSAAALPATPSYASDAAGAARVQFSLNNAIRGALCVTDRDGIRVVLDPINVGHQWPSGAAQDRRVWAEVIAYKGGKVVYQSGVVPDGTPVGRQTTDTDLADLWLLRDQMLGVDGGPVDMFWQAASAYGNELPAAKSFDTSSPLFVLGHIGKSFPRDGSPIQGGVDRVTLRIRIQPIGLDVLNDLVSSHDLDPTVAAAMPTFDVPIVNRPDSSPPPLLEWTPEAAAPDASSIPVFVDTEDRSDVRCVGAPNFDAVHTGPQTKATCP